MKDLPSYKILYSATESYAAHTLVYYIADTLKTRCGVTLPVCSDADCRDFDRAIVIGSRSHAASNALRVNLPADSYAIKKEGTSLLVVYTSPAARLYAIRRVTSLLAENKITERFFDTGTYTRAESGVFSDIACLRDPFVLVVGETLYAYGTGWEVYRNTSGTLVGHWEPLGRCVKAPDDFKDCDWAPEVHRYKDAYYMFTTYRSSETGRRECFILRADKPEGPFLRHSVKHLTPKDWDCIDGTLYIDKSGDPYMVFVHEWITMPDKVGTFAVARLSADLTHLVSAPTELFRADDAAWATEGITDGCFLYRTEEGSLLMLWSNVDSDGYAVGIARSESGEIEGPWTQERAPLYSKASLGVYDGGHGMIFTHREKKYLSIHSPNAPHPEESHRACFFPVREENDTLVLDL